MSIHDSIWTDDELALLKAGINARWSWARIATTIPGRSAYGCQLKALSLGWMSRYDAKAEVPFQAPPTDIERAVDILRRFEVRVCAMTTVAEPHRRPQPYGDHTKFMVGDVADVPAAKVIEMAHRCAHAAGGICT